MNKAVVIQRRQHNLHTNGKNNWQITHKALTF